MKNAKRRTLDGRSGLTLVETIVALTLFAFFIGGVCGLLNMVKEASDSARDHYVAANLAKNRIERAKEFGYENVPLFVESDVVLDESGKADTDGRYQRSTTITMPSTNLYLVSVSVEIRNRRTLGFGVEDEVVQTYITNMAGPPEDE